MCVQLGRVLDLFAGEGLGRRIQPRHEPRLPAALLLRRQPGGWPVVPGDRPHGGQQPCVAGHAAPLRRAKERALLELRPWRLRTEHQGHPHVLRPWGRVQDRHQVSLPGGHGVPGGERRPGRHAHDPPAGRPRGGDGTRGLQPGLPQVAQRCLEGRNEPADHLLGRRAADHAVDGHATLRAGALQRGERRRGRDQRHEHLAARGAGV
mmetsp:Transcript_405/g.1357  ORF Transcript_405/g.1357 Transcript_405/m.1357 type:complete len:207 (+) Transcript_405:365-985(+)